jgi:hypothetical protein
VAAEQVQRYVEDAGAGGFGFGGWFRHFELNTFKTQNERSQTGCQEIFEPVQF